MKCFLVKENEPQLLLWQPHSSFLSRVNSIPALKYLSQTLKFYVFFFSFSFSFLSSPPSPPFLSCSTYHFSTHSLWGIQSSRNGTGREKLNRMPNGHWTRKKKRGRRGSSSPCFFLPSWNGIICSLLLCSPLLGFGGQTNERHRRRQTTLSTSPSLRW